MGNTTSITRSESSHWDFTASDMLLDQMEKQSYVVAAPTWIEAITTYFALVLSTMVALLTGSFSKPKRASILVDTACQTEDEYFFAELIVNRDWMPCHVDCKEVNDDDTHSCTSEETELFTDAENEEDELNFSDSEWENEDSASEDMLHAICDACENCADCDCETQAEQLLHLSAIVCQDNNDFSPIYLEDYLCKCGECPQYKEIADDVAAAAKTSRLQTQSITRLLQAFSTYNEAIGYRADMIPAACECLRVWNGDEDKAFKSFVTLYDEVPRLCDPTNA
ncbi:hypothetical protein GN244_ATG06885 [Phytophthora infestans]|uniref:Uncharacterized protein n=1 Tax=Phytophthora infestans TaxID=4787 RepID=A0A833SX24_PHYIN|nr:hypothetical protein GN244_ATG06885 [Phytophthora infestans]KAF4136014.1 hypothetical protein GN958_ATG14760 [Phytophthora infestans]